MALSLLRGGAAPETLDSLTTEWLGETVSPPDAEAIARQTIDALSDPLGLPPLARCLTPDDHVAIAAGHHVPPAVVRGAAAALAAAGIDRSRIRVVTANVHELQPLEEALAPEAEAGVQVESHDPADDKELCFTGLARGDRPLLVNRTVFEADFVLPISAESTGGEAFATDEAGGAYDGLFPDFFDAHTIERFRKVRSVNDAAIGAEARRDSRRAEADQAGWLVGAPMVMRVVPGPGGGVAAMLAGVPEQVVAAATDAGREAWQTPLAEPADVVLARVTGGPDQQTWASVGRALAAADRLARPGAVLAVWSELDEPIGEELGFLAEADDPGEVAAKLAGASGEAALAAWRVWQALDRGPVFFRSKLPSESVEALGLAPVESAEQMERLVNRFEDAVVLEEAQHVRFPEPAESEA